MPSMTSLCSAGIQHRKQPRRNDAGADRRQRAAVSAVMRWPARLGQVASQRGDHQHRFQPLAKQNDGSLNECR